MLVKGWYGDRKRLVGEGKNKQRHIVEIPQGRTSIFSNKEGPGEKKKFWWSGAVG